MNIFQGEIKKIETAESLSLVEIQVGEILFKTIILETQDSVSYLKEKNSVQVFFKETAVVIGRGMDHSVSMQNKISGNVVEIEKDLLLSRLKIKTDIGNISSVITTSAVQQLILTVGEEVTAMIKTNEIIISE